MNMTFLSRTLVAAPSPRSSVTCPIVRGGLVTSGECNVPYRQCGRLRCVFMVRGAALFRPLGRNSTHFRWLGSLGKTDPNLLCEAPFMSNTLRIACAHCGSVSVRSSRQALNFFAVIYCLTFRLARYRCMSCSGRFYGPRRPSSLRPVYDDNPGVGRRSADQNGPG
jgi:hypothetical protein